MEENEERRFGVCGRKKQVFPSKTKEGCYEMNYDSIAEMVNKLVKNPSSRMSSELEQSSAELTKSEFTIIQNVFSKYGVSGNAVTIAALPLTIWK